MSQNNQISAAITAANQTAITNAIDAIKATLVNVLIVNLTAQQRLEIAKMGDKTFSFVNNALTYAGQNPALVPAFLNIAEANKDYQLAKELNLVYQQLNTLLKSVEDAMMVAGGEAYDAALIFYSAVKGAQRSNLPGAAAIYNDLKTQFPRGVKPTVTPAPEAPKS